MRKPLAALAAVVALAGCGVSQTHHRAQAPTAPTVPTTTTSRPPPTTTTTSSAGPRTVTLNFSDPSSGWTYAGTFPLPQQSINIAKDISSSPPRMAKFSVTRNGTPVPELTFTTTNPGRPNGPSMMLKPGTFLYDLPASARTAADTPAGAGYGVLLSNVCGTDPFAPYGDGSTTSTLPAQAECQAVGTGPDVDMTQNALTMESTDDYPESIVDALVGTYTHPAYQLAVPTGPTQDPEDGPDKMNYCYATILADGTVTHSLGERQIPPVVPLCPNLHISVSG